MTYINLTFYYFALLNLLRTSFLNQSVFNMLVFIFSKNSILITTLCSMVGWHHAKVIHQIQYISLGLFVELHCTEISLCTADLLKDSSGASILYKGCFRPYFGVEMVSTYRTFGFAFYFNTFPSKSECSVRPNNSGTE